MNTIQKITSVFLVIVLLLSGLGFTINKMVCLKSGKVKISLIHVKNCCSGKTSDKPTIKSNCCDLKNTTFNLDDFSSSQKTTIPFADNFVFAFWQNNLFQISKSERASILFVADLPPPLHGRQLLSFISTLII